MTTKEELLNMKAELIFAIQKNIMYAELYKEPKMVEVHKMVLERILNK